MIYTPANTKCFTNEYNTNVRIKPEMIVPKIESSGFFIYLLLEHKKLFYNQGDEIISKPSFRQELQPF